jgi:hypothetical protein
VACSGPDCERSPQQPPSVGGGQAPSAHGDAALDQDLYQGTSGSSSCKTKRGPERESISVLLFLRRSDDSPPAIAEMAAAADAEQHPQSATGENAIAAGMNGGTLVELHRDWAVIDVPLQTRHRIFYRRQHGSGKNHIALAQADESQSWSSPRVLGRPLAMARYDANSSTETFPARTDGGACYHGSCGRILSFHLLLPMLIYRRTLRFAREAWQTCWICPLPGW